MVALVLCSSCQPAGQPLPMGGVTPEPAHDCAVGHTTPGLIGGWECPCPCPKPKSDMQVTRAGLIFEPRVRTAPTPASDELREQLRAALRKVRATNVWMYVDDATVIKAVMKPVQAHLDRARADDRNPKQCPRCMNWCVYDGWGHTHAYGDVGIGSCDGDLRATVARVRALADEAEAKGQVLQAIPELQLIGNAYVGMAERIRAALETPTVSEPKELPYGTMLLTHDPLKEQGY